MSTPSHGGEAPCDGCLVRTEKHCPKCDETKPLSEFYRNRSAHDGLTSYCKPCHNTTRTKQQRKDPEATREYNAAWRETNPEKAKASARASYLKRTFAITPAQYDEILALQGGVCAICHRPPGRTRLAVDHDHKTGAIRGLLCPVLCNHDLLGRRDQQPEIFLRAYEYLLNPPAIAVLGEGHKAPGRRRPKRRKQVSGSVRNSAASGRVIRTKTTKPRRHTNG